MPNDNVLTAEARATIMDACQSISRRADGLKAGCAIGDEWPDAEDKAFYDAELRLLARLVALLNDSGQSEPETATVARIEQLRKALFESRDAMRVMSNWVKKSDPAGHSWAVRMVDRANAALNGEPEPRFEVMDAVRDALDERAAFDILESALREKLCGEPVAFVCSAGNPFAPIIRDKVAAQKLSDEHGDGKIIPLYALNRSKA